MRRLVYYAALTAPGAVVEAAHFPPRHRSDHEAFAKGQFDSLSLEEIVRHKVSHFFDRLGNVEAREVHRAVISQVERALIEQCLKWADGNQLKTARVLGINRNTLRKRMKELGIKI
jgi:DNA-binding protein Fis